MRLAQYRHLLIPLATLLSAFIGSQVAADATGRVFTCHESNESQWQMTQPQAHVDAGYWPTWTDCLAWRNGDPGPEYIWSYGQTAPTTTTEAPTTTVEPITTTAVPPTPAPTEPPTTTTTTPSTTTMPATTTTSVAPTTTYQQTTSAPIPSTTQTTATTIETTTSVATSTTVPETTTTTSTSVPSDPRVRQAAAVIKAELAPGVTPQQAQTVLVISAVTTAFTSTRRNNK